ncbi:BatA domain-containing protein [Anatilimnocola floriformis]|uniref:BatA domain-containing protein n=1 Tax=Anatilimnocola floriformis TaxID=2948575 RepID=UPI0020C29011|nr:BatA domain-containing protein [Anatilimnocola floriformis]
MPFLIGQFEALGGLSSWAGTFLTNPLLAGIGLAAISVPIIIHLLNKRQFKIVDWAAMEFLLDAEKKNRRRVRLENLILLLLRCLAIFLLGLLLARPFFPTAMTAGLIDAQQFERIILLDDSLSMQTRQGNDSIWDLTRKRVVDLTNSLSDGSQDNSLTLLLTSRPDKPVYNGAHLSRESVTEINDLLGKLEASDQPAGLPAALKELEQYLSSQPANINRVVYIVSDLRQHDWRANDETPESPAKMMTRISKLASASYIVDVGDTEDRNLAITAVKPEGTLVEGVSSRFDVSVSNFGSTEAKDVRVKFVAGEALPLQNEIDKIGPGETVNTSFAFAFTGDEETDGAAGPGQLAPRKVKIEVSSAAQGEDDRLPADSISYFPARLVRGIPALIVDGDPSSAFGKAESFYLKRALSPHGPVPSGIAADIVTESEFESLKLDKYQVIFLLNVYRLGEKPEETIAALERWVAAGGGLVIFPGDQIDEAFFNQHYFKDGKGLSPLKLENIKGDETDETWSLLRVEQTNHEVLKVFGGQNNPFLDNVKLFRWWGSSPIKEQVGNQVAITAKLNDPDDSPAFAERSFGQGRVFFSAVPADADWTNWTSDPSYLIVMQEMVRYLAGNRGDQGLLRVAQPIRQPLDLTNYEIDASLEGPRERKANVQATAIDGDEPAKKDEPATTPQPLDVAAVAPTNGKSNGQATVWRLEYPSTDLQGFYELKLARRGSTNPETVLFAANVDPTEGDLKRVDQAVLKKNLGDAKVEIITADKLSGLDSSGANSEIWWYLLWAVVVVLCSEQLFAWWFGRAR